MKILKEREELEKNMNYNPFGKGGAGAPVRDPHGNLKVGRSNNIEASHAPYPPMNA